ncbi:AAA family ATPase, partial [Candidatus Paralachnospira sp. LCP21S3_H12]
LSQDDLLSSTQMMEYCKKTLDKWQMQTLERQIEAAKAMVQARTAWRIEGTLREFPKFQPVNLWFDFPVHRIDQSGALGDVEPEVEKPMWQRGRESRKKQSEQA